MKFSVFLLTPAVVTASTSAPTTFPGNPCASGGATTTDCNGVTQDCTAWNNQYCDDGTTYEADFNCARFDYDGGDCETVTDCDGNQGLVNLVGDGTCDDGSTQFNNFDCLEFDYDSGDCDPTDCDNRCIDAYPTDDGTCQEEFNCKKFEYSFQQCYEPECPDDWYDLGRDNYRCSQRTGGTRFASKVMSTFNECECYDFCQGKAEDEGVTLSAFDNYSDKCRCWTGECTDASTIACKDDGDRADEFSGSDGRCPSATYFPHDQVFDCSGNQDVTIHEGYFMDNYQNDGFCDNKELGNDRVFSEIGDYQCNDGDDCEYATCDEIFEITQFATLDEPNLVCDGHAGEITREADWTTACDCYELCAGVSSSDTVVFQRNNQNQCQCLSSCESQTNCGLESQCQIFTAERQTDCCGDDWTLGMGLNDFNAADHGEFYDRYISSIQERSQGNKILTIEDLRTISQTFDLCIPEFLCEEYSYSFGSTESIEYGTDDDSDGVYSTIDILESPCFDCSMDDDAELASNTVQDMRCEQVLQGNDAVRYAQLQDYYRYVSQGGLGLDADDVEDYCSCEVYCRLQKFYAFVDPNACAATSGYQGYINWSEDPSTQFAVDAYKGDCRCWDFCTVDTLAPCTVGAVDRCSQGPTQTTFPDLQQID